MRYQEDLGRQTGCSGKESYSWEEKASSYVAQLASQSLAKFADEFGVSEESLRQLGIGFDQYAYTFPMMNAQGQVVGIRYRPQKDPHSKTTAEGSKVGLFIPKGVTGASLEIICEGETDTAASLTLGFRAIGTPFSSYSPHEIITFLRDCPVACPCIIGDNDPSGRNGAENLAEALKTAGTPCRILFPPEEHNDLRDWQKAGLTHDELARSIESQPVRWPTDWPSGFAQLPNALLRRGFAAQNGSTALGLALLIKSYEGKRKAFPKASDLAKLLGVNVSTVHRNKRRLEKLGILSWDRGRTGRANEYSVNLGPERWNHQTKK